MIDASYFKHLNQITGSFSFLMIPLVLYAVAGNQTPNNGIRDYKYMIRAYAVYNGLSGALHIAMQPEFFQMGFNFIVFTETSKQTEDKTIRLLCIDSAFFIACLTAHACNFYYLYRVVRGKTPSFDMVFVLCILPFLTGLIQFLFAYSFEPCPEITEMLYSTLKGHSKDACLDHIVYIAQGYKRCGNIDRSSLFGFIFYSGSVAISLGTTFTCFIMILWKIQTLKKVEPSCITMPNLETPRTTPTAFGSSQTQFLVAITFQFLIYIFFRCIPIVLMIITNITQTDIYYLNTISHVLSALYPICEPIPLLVVFKEFRERVMLLPGIMMYLVRYARTLPFPRY